MVPPNTNTDIQNKHDHEIIEKSLIALETGMKEGFRLLHEDLNKVVVDVNGKCEKLTQKQHQTELENAKLEGRLKLVEQVTQSNAGYWQKIIYTGLGAAVIAVMAGIAKIGGAF